jgi:hypothetical protein
MELESQALDPLSCEAVSKLESQALDLLFCEAVSKCN